MTANQRLVDRLLRAKVYALGYAKHVTESILKFLDDTEPEIRKELLDIFGTNTGVRTVTRLRDAEKRLSRARGLGWAQATSEAFAMLLDLVKDEDVRLVAAAGKKLVTPTAGAIVSATRRALLAGHTLKEWFTDLKLADIRRMIGQLRVSVLGGETVAQTLRRLMGKLSPVAIAAKNAVASIIATAVTALSSKVRELTVGLNGSTFDMELWVSILDNRTTRGCRDLDGEVFPRGQGIQPGYHFFCRSDRIPLMTDGGEIATLGSYSAWIGTQDSAFRRYAGKKEFSYKNLRPISLEDFRNGTSED